MNIKIYTYSDPYNITSEPYWEQIRNCPQFCASHTMANGLKRVYGKEFGAYQLSTVSELVNALYYDWEKTNKKIMQMMEIDSVINSLFDDSDTKRALSYNMKSISKSIRLFSELGLELSNIKKENLSVDQLYVYSIYEAVSKRNNSYFKFDRVTDSDTIDNALKVALTGNHNEVIPLDIDFDSIVIHGVYQFTPSILAAIEDISRFKNVIFIFNFQQNYGEIYAPWIRIYSEFDKKIELSVNKVTPSLMNDKSYPYNKLAESIGEMYDGLKVDGIKLCNDIEIVEFENTTEFAGYIAAMYDEAVHQKMLTHSPRATLSFMPEKFYSTSSAINDLLRSYFPEQFGERHFLDYPVGHFFVSVVEMWDAETENIRFEEMSQIKECLSAGILEEERFGQNLNTFNQISAFVDGENTIDGLIARLKLLKKTIKKDYPDRKRIEYFQVSKEDLTILINAIEQLKEIIEDFFSGFSSGGDNFRRFYKKVAAFIAKEIKDNDKFDANMQDLTERLLSKLNASNLPDTGTIVCLKETLTYYLSQEESVFVNANRIVNDFEQIDGDVLESDSSDNEDVCFHFCQLSDYGICSEKSDSLPWPLDVKFFSEACTIIDWKYFVFLRSKMEQKYFKRYSLVYGLEFLRNTNCKLSYVKNESGRENDLFFMFDLLNIKVTKYVGSAVYYKTPQMSFELDSSDKPEYDESDERRWNICKYRFAIESLVQNRTIYRNKYLIQKYISILLENDILMKMKNKVFNIDEIKSMLLDSYEELDTRFKIANEFEKNNLIYTALKSIMFRYRKSNILRNINESTMDLREDLLGAFIDENLDYQKKNEIDSILHNTERFDYELGKNCLKCSCKDICLQYNFDE